MNKNLAKKLVYQQDQNSPEPEPVAALNLNMLEIKELKYSLANRIRHGTLSAIKESAKRHPPACKRFQPP